MKVDIPDKILINRGKDGKLHHSYWTTDQELVPFEDTLYIRKNALIEWASNMLGQVSDMGFDDGDVEHGYTRALQDLIDELNSM